MFTQLLTLNFIAFAGITIATSSLGMAGLMFLLGNHSLNRSWGAFCLAVALWGISFFFIGTTNDPERAELWWRISHIGVIAIPVLFVYFVYEFLERKDWLLVWVILGVSSVFLYANIFTSWLIRNVEYKFNSFYYDSPPGILYLPFVVFFLMVILHAHGVLLRAYRISTDYKKREQIRYFFMATLVGFMGGCISFVPVFGLDIYPYTVITVTLYPIIMGYAILKYQLFDIKVVAAQLTAVGIGGFSFIQVFLSTGAIEIIFSILLCIVAVTVGVYLIYSVKKEVQAREENEQLVSQLGQANERLRELDKMKSEFVSIASHQLRSPVTSIRGYASMLLDGSYGKMPKKARGAIERINESSRLMALSVEDYLNVSRIQSGNMKYEKSDFDIAKLISDVVDDLRRQAVRSGLVLTSKVQLPENSNTKVHADKNKTVQIIRNLVDNAMKYTKEGSVTVTVSKCTDRAALCVAVTDTGVGMHAEEIEELFAKFRRAQDANNVNANGTGLGLFIARKMAQDMGGNVTASSPGKGEGSTFTVCLPMTRENES